MCDADCVKRFIFSLPLLKDAGQLGVDSLRFTGTEKGAFDRLVEIAILRFCQLMNVRFQYHVKKFHRRVLFNIRKVEWREDVVEGGRSVGGEE